MQALDLLTTQFSLSGSRKGAESKRGKPSSFNAAVGTANMAMEPFHVFEQVGSGSDFPIML